MVRGCGELDQQGRPARVGSDRPPRPERLVRGERLPQPLDAALGATAEHRHEEVVERTEVVVELDPRLGLHPSGGDGRVAVSEHDLLGGVEDPDALLGSGRAGAPGLDHPSVVRPLTPPRI